jgi:hypothetical protein
MSSLITRSLVKKYLLERAKALRPYHPFTQVSGETFDALEARFRNICDDAIRSHPAVGKTIKISNR